MHVFIIILANAGAFRIPLHICANALVEISARDSCHGDASNRIFCDFHLQFHLTDVRMSRFILTLTLLFASTNKLIRDTVACTQIVFL